ncbi:MAG TPA: lysylphosphatidylglycerol synthase domain-containing protein [Oscillatoriaceae cyanobacterium]
MEAPVANRMPAAIARRAWPIVRWPLVALLVGAMWHAAEGQWRTVSVHDLHLDWRWGALSLLGLVGTLAWTCALWRRWLVGLGAPLPYARAFSILFQANVAKYLPGAGWHFVGRVGLSHQAGISPAKATLSIVMETACHLAAGALLSLLALPLLPGVRPEVWPFAAAAIAVPLAMHPRVLDRAFGLLGWLTRRTIPPVPFSYRFVLGMLAGYLAYWIALGACFAMFAQSLSSAPVTLAQSALLTGALAIAWVAGAVTLVAPAGLGVREAALVVLVGAAFPAGWAIVFALASRLWFLASEAIAFAIACVAWRRA